MKTLDLRQTESEFFERRFYPDQQPHIKVKGLISGDNVKVIAPIRSSLELVELMLLVNAIKHIGSRLAELAIPYLMAARFDRIMEEGDSFDLEVVAQTINSFGFARVRLFDVHSDAALDLIENSTGRTNKNLVVTYAMKDAVIIIPDKGAALKAGRYAWWNKNLKDEVQCNKSRDLSTGKITLTVQDPDVCKDRNCVIIDDLCDGGGTFLAIASQIQPKHLTLMVTHGIFSKGFRELEKHFQSIITTDSFRKWGDWDSKIITCHALEV